MSIESKNLWRDEYELYWTNNFPAGPQKIFLINTLLDIRLVKDKSFNNWKEFARYLFKSRHKEWFFGLCNLLDGSIEEEDSVFSKRIRSIKNSKKLFNLLIDQKYYCDPIIFVRADNQVLQWLMEN